MVRTELGCKLLGFPLILIISLFLALFLARQQVLAQMAAGK